MQTDTKAGTKGGVREFSRKRRLMNQAGSIVKNPYNIMVVISVIFMVYLILIPLGQMIIHPQSVLCGSYLLHPEDSSQQWIYAVDSP